MQRLTNASFGCLFRCFMKPSKPCTLAFLCFVGTNFLQFVYSCTGRCKGDRYLLESSRVHFFFRSNQWNLGSRWYRFPIWCGMLYCTTTNNSQEFLRHYFSLRNHSFARVNQIDSCFMFSYKSAFIWLGRGIRTGIVQKPTVYYGTRTTFSVSFPFLVGLCLFPFLVRFTRTYVQLTDELAR